MKKLGLAVVMVVLFGISSQAFAQQWGGQTWDYSTDGVFGSFSNDDSNVLHFLNKPDGGGGWASGVNTNYLDFTQDFAYGLRYYLDGSQLGDVCLEFGLRDDDGYTVGSVVSSYYGDREVSFIDNYWNQSMDEVDYTVEGIPADGWLGVRYSQDNDTIGFGLSDGVSLLRGGEISGFTQDYIVPEYNPQGFKIFLAGWSGGAEVVSGMATFSEFSGTGNQTVTPEPVSSALFLLGGGTLVARRLKRKK